VTADQKSNRELRFQRKWSIEVPLAESDTLPWKQSEWTDFQGLKIFQKDVTPLGKGHFRWTIEMHYQHDQETKQDSQNADAEYLCSFSYDPKEVKMSLSRKTQLSQFNDWELTGVGFVFSLVSDLKHGLKEDS
jgi:hypothetical protein